MEIIAAYSFPYQAHLAKIRLESEGIPVIITDENMIGLNWLYSVALGGVKVQVPDSYVELAKNALQQDHSKDLISEKGITVFHCKVCDSENIEYYVKGQQMAFLTQLLLGAPLWPIKKKLKCNDCANIENYKT